jgi:hypothetical protein
MRILAIVAAAIVALAAFAAALVAIRLAGESGEGALFITALIVSGLVYPAVMAGVVVGATDPGSPNSTKTVRRITLVSAGLQLLAGVGLVVYASAVALPVVVVVVLIGGALILTTLYVAGGRAGRARRTTDPRDEQPFGTAEVAAKWRRVAAASAVALVASIAVGAALGSDGLAGHPWTVILFALSLALMTAGAAAVIVSWPLLARLQRVADGTRLIARAVVKNRPGMLTQDQRVSAARYAAIYSSYLPFQHVQMTSLITGLLLLQLAALHDDNSPGPTTVVVRCAFLVAVAVSIPLYARQHRNVRRYAADSAHLLTETRVAG